MSAEDQTVAQTGEEVTQSIDQNNIETVTIPLDNHTTTNGHTTNGHTNGHIVEQPVKQAAIKEQAVEMTGKSQSNDPYALPAIPSLNDYLEYIKLLQSCWKDSPRVDVVFNNLTYIVPIAPDEVRIPSIGHAFSDFVKTLTFRTPPKVPLHVFDNCSGTIPSGKMTLILAPPGAGKSQLVKALAGRLRRDKRVTGDLWYNGLTADEQLQAGFFVEKLCALVAQGDVHFANLTVRETLQFALESCVSDPAMLDNPDPKLLAWHKRKVDLLLSVLGMHECAETIAGNAVIRGISGGQKKRLTIGEFMITNARVLLLDEPTTGLDAAVARDIMVVLREWCQIAGATVISALLQPTPEQYELYDNLILLREGVIVYQGPRDDIYQFLWDYHGIEADPEQDIADFLVDWLTEPKLIYAKQRRRWMKRGGPTEIPGVNGVPIFKNKPTTETVAKPDTKAAWNHEEKEAASVDESAAVQHQQRRHSRSAKSNNADVNGQEPHVGVKLAPTVAVRTNNESMVAAYRSSPWFANQQVEIDKVIRSREGGNSLQIVKQQAASASHYTREQFSRLYARPFLSHTASSLRRQFVLLSRDSQTIPARLFSAILVAVILGSLFLRLGTSQSDTYSKFGMILFALLNSAMGNFTELPAAFEGRNAVYKHLDAGMYPSLSYMFSVVCAWIPVMFLETVMFSIPLYFMVGLAEDAGRFFFFFLILFTTDLMLAALYRTVCYTVATIDQGQQVLNPVFNFMILFGGFLITRSKIPDVVGVF